MKTAAIFTFQWSDNFWTFPRPWHYRRYCENSRAISLLERMGLTARILSDSDDVQMKMDCEIGRQKVQGKLCEFRVVGMSYLKRVFS